MIEFLIFLLSLSISLDNRENPKKLPQLQVKDTIIVNADEIFGNRSFVVSETGGSLSRSSKVWLAKKDKVLVDQYGNSCLAWGEMNLIEQSYIENRQIGRNFFRSICITCYRIEKCPFSKIELFSYNYVYPKEIEKYKLMEDVVIEVPVAKEKVVAPQPIPAPAVNPHDS